MEKPQPFALTEAVMRNILAQTEDWEPFGVAAHGSNPQSKQMADRLCSFLLRNGAKVHRSPDVPAMARIERAITIGQEDSGSGRVLYIDADRL